MEDTTEIDIIECEQDSSSIKYQCSVCNFSFSNVEEHFEKYHKNIEDTNEPIEVEIVELSHVEIIEDEKQKIENPKANKKQAVNMISCHICNITFYDKSKFKLHMKAKHDKTEDKYDQVKIFNKGKDFKESHTCAYCGKIFKRPHEKLKHERVHTKVKPYICDICGKTFRVVYCLSLHKKNVHSEERPYVCLFDGCNKSFKSQSVYNHHLKTHDTEKKYKCSLCPKTFKTAVQLNGHKNSHLKPFECQICKRSFSSLYSVKNHMEVHKNSNSSLKHICSVCGASYARAFALNDHVKVAHPNVVINENVESYSSTYEVLNVGNDEVLYSVVIQDRN